MIAPNKSAKINSNTLQIYTISCFYMLAKWKTQTGRQVLKILLEERQIGIETDRKKRK